MDSPAFLFKEGRKSNDEEFNKPTKNDIRATIRFLYQRGMWSKYHYTMWTKELESCKDSEMLHLWWDSIVGGAMFEVEGRLEARLEAIEEAEADKIEQESMKYRQMKNCKMKK